MQTKPILALLTALSLLAFAPTGRAADITANGSGNWSSTNVDAPWPNGIVPGPNDDVDVEAPYNITVDTNTVIQFIYGSGTVTMGANTTLNILGDPAGGQGTQSLGLLDTSATGNTVIYSGNPFWAKHQDYYNLVFSNIVTTSVLDFYNGNIGVAGDNAVAMNIAGNMTMIGKLKVQQGDDITVGGNLIIGTNSSWDCSSFNLTVGGNTTIGGLLVDLDGALGANYFMGDVTVTAGSVGWNVSDVTQWMVGGSLTNNGLIAGKGYGSINFGGTGSITGSKPIKIPTMTVSGTYKIGTTVTLTTNTPTLNGTLVFDLANTNRLALAASAGTPLFYAGQLEVVNSGAPPVSGASYQFFSAPSYGGSFGSTSFPSLPAGLSWMDNTLLSGSIRVGSDGAAPPILSVSSSGGVLTLSWDSTTFPGYRVQAQTNSGGISNNWGNTGSGTVSPFTIPINPANRTVFFRLINP